MSELFPSAPKPKLLPCITLWRPWANWIALGWKKIETRTHARFAKLVGHRIGIHCGLAWDKSAIDAARNYLTEKQVEETDSNAGAFCPRFSGTILCMARVSSVGWLNASDSPAALIDCSQESANGGASRYGLLLDDLRPSPIDDPVQGRQGIFYVPLPDSNV